MKACEACKVDVLTTRDFCPLCGTPLQEQPQATGSFVANHYPDLSVRRTRYNFIGRLLAFVTLTGCGLSVLVNLLTGPRTLWSLIVVGAAAYCWLVIPPLLRKGVNYAKQAMFQVLFTGALVVGIDFFIGYTGWSVSYVLPGLFIAGSAAIGLLAMFNRTNWAQYALYQVLLGLFGFIPLVLYLVGLAHNLVLVLVAAGLSLASLVATIVFGDRSIKMEFKRRFHL